MREATAPEGTLLKVSSSSRSDGSTRTAETFGMTRCTITRSRRRRAAIRRPAASRD